MDLCTKYDVYIMFCNAGFDERGGGGGGVQIQMGLKNAFL